MSSVVISPKHIFALPIVVIANVGGPYSNLPLLEVVGARVDSPAFNPCKSLEKGSVTQWCRGNRPLLNIN